MLFIRYFYKSLNIFINALPNSLSKENIAVEIKFIMGHSVIVNAHSNQLINLVPQMQSVGNSGSFLTKVLNKARSLELETHKIRHWIYAHKFLLDSELRTGFAYSTKLWIRRSIYVNFWISCQKFVSHLLKIIAFLKIRQFHNYSWALSKNELRFIVTLRIYTKFSHSQC